MVDVMFHFVTYFVGKYLGLLQKTKHCTNMDQCSDQMNRFLYFVQDWWDMFKSLFYRQAEQRAEHVGESVSWHFNTSDWTKNCVLCEICTLSNKQRENKCLHASSSICMHPCKVWSLHHPENKTCSCVVNPFVVSSLHSWRHKYQTLFPFDIYSSVFALSINMNMSCVSVENQPVLFVILLKTRTQQSVIVVLSV